MKIDHNIAAAHRIETILQHHSGWQEFCDWQMENFSRVFDWDVKTTGRKDLAHTRAIRFYKEVFGRQDTCVVFRHRSWVWHRPNAGWTLYVDRRGPALHVSTASTEKAWAAFQDFHSKVDAFFK